MTGFADLHCHILPNVDDGPKSLEDSLAMLRIAGSEGFTDIVATPHYAPQIPGFQGFPDSTSSAIAVSRLAVVAREFGITIHEGSEIRLDEHAYANFKAGRCSPLGNNRHVLLELPDDAVLAYHYGWMSEFVADGWIPVLAHVERLQALQADPYALKDWEEAGCLLQVNASSLLERSQRACMLVSFIRWIFQDCFGNRLDPHRKTAKVLLKKGLCHLIATDSHSSTYRPPRMREAYVKASRLVGEAAARRLFCLEPRRILGLPDLDEAIEDGM